MRSPQPLQNEFPFVCGCGGFIDTALPLGLVQRGFAASKDEVADLTKRRQQIEKGLKSWEQVRSAVRAGGRLYADPEDEARYEKAKRLKELADRGAPEARLFLGKRNTTVESGYVQPCRTDVAVIKYTPKS